MSLFFTPRYLKEAKIILKNAHKLLHYKRDLISPERLAEFTKTTEALELAIKAHDEKKVRETIQQLETQWNVYLPPAKEAGWRENCEVFLVAIIIAVGVRTYFIQPFTIPTGSMQPTLYGIIGTETNKPAPNFLVRMLHAGLYGRSYIDLVAGSDEKIISVTEHTWLRFFTVTDVQCTNQTFHAWTAKETLLRYFHLDPTREYRKGDVIARGYVNTGDHVFVDKFTYHFLPPNRGNVFVFSTKDIRGLEAHHDPREGSQYYIKRLAGLPGDTLRIDSPKLFVNGALAQGTGFERVMSQLGDYHGYAQGPAYGLLNSPDTPLRLPAKSYVALGDNSYNSLDSRYWGFVPERNIMGRALFVYWPFAEHWGFIK